MPQPLIAISSKRAFVFAGFLVLYETLTYFANDMIMPGMIKVVQSFHGQESSVASSLTAYMLGGASLQLLLGPLSDRFGRRPVMVFGALFFFISTLLIATSQSMEQFLIFRFFQGMGLCFISVIGYATLQEIFSEMDAVRLIALMVNVSMIAPLAGPLLGAMLIQYCSWRSLFGCIALFALLALWGLWQFMPETVGVKKRDGTIIPRADFSFHVISKNYKKLFLNRFFMWGCLAMGIELIPCLAWIGLSPVMVVSDAKQSLFVYGLWQIPIFGATILGSWILQGLTYYLSLMKIIAIGSIIVLMSLIGAWVLPLLKGNYFLWILPGLTMYSLGFGLCSGPLCRRILFSTSVTKGTASAVLGMAGMLLQGLGLEVSNVIYARGHSTVHLGLYFAIIGILYCVILGFCTGVFTSRGVVRSTR